MLLGRLQVRLLTVKFGGSKKLYLAFQLQEGVSSTLNPLRCSRINCISEASSLEALQIPLLGWTTRRSVLRRLQGAGGKEAPSSLLSLPWWCPNTQTLQPPPFLLSSALERRYWPSLAWPSESCGPCRERSTFHVIWILTWRSCFLFDLGDFE